jgi:protein-disulfide isomerase
MASRAKAKEEARARRIAEEQARAAAHAKARRMQRLGGVVILAIVAVAVAIAISSGGSSGGTGLLHGKALTTAEASVNSLLTGIPQSGDTLGSPSAPVTMTYFGDLECPVCQAFTLSGGLPQLVSNEVRQGKVKVVYSPFCTATCNSHPHATFANQQIAALAAGQQNKFWNYVELFYHQQASETSNYVTENYLDTLAREIPGLNLATWKSARSSQALSQQLATQEQSGTAQGITGTPTLIFSGPKGKAQPNTSVPSYSDLQSSLKQVQ